VDVEIEKVIEEAAGLRQYLTVDMDQCLLALVAKGNISRR